MGRKPSRRVVGTAESVVAGHYPVPGVGGDASFTVYRCWDVDGQLLYVGCTKNLPSRIKDHEEKADWYGQVHRITQEYFSDRETALAREKEVIATEDPSYNQTYKRLPDGSPAPLPPPRPNAERLYKRSLEFRPRWHWLGPLARALGRELVELGKYLWSEPGDLPHNGMWRK